MQWSHSDLTGKENKTDGLMEWNDGLKVFNISFVKHPFQEYVCIQCFFWGGGLTNTVLMSQMSSHSGIQCLSSIWQGSFLAGFHGHINYECGNVDRQKRKLQTKLWKAKKMSGKTRVKIWKTAPRFYQKQNCICFVYIPVPY